jgi:hypothetical protein
VVSLPELNSPLDHTAVCLYLVARDRTVSEMAKRDIAVCIDAYPDSNTDVFRISAADDVLRPLADAHDTEFTVYGSDRLDSLRKEAVADE